MDGPNEQVEELNDIERGAIGAEDEEQDRDEAAEFVDVGGAAGEDEEPGKEEDEEGEGGEDLFEKRWLSPETFFWMADALHG